MHRHSRGTKSAAEDFEPLDDVSAKGPDVEGQGIMNPPHRPKPPATEPDSDPID